MTDIQKTIIIVGVPEPARNKNAVDNVAKMEPTIATSDLNHRFRIRTINRAVRTAMIIDGSLTE